MIKKIRAWFASDVPVALGAQHVGWIVAAVILLNVGCFAVGYFWGKRAGAQEWCTVISRDAFADQIYNSLCLASVGDDEEKDEEADSQEISDNAEGQMRLLPRPGMPKMLLSRVLKSRPNIMRNLPDFRRCAALKLLSHGSIKSRFLYLLKNG